MCVGATHEQYSAVARSVGGDAEVIAAPDTSTALRLLRGRDDGPTSTPVLEHGPLRIDRTERIIYWADEPLSLCAREFDLLTTLAHDWGRVWSFAELTEVVWKRPYIGDSDAVISAVKRLRRRIAAVTDDLVIESVRGVGFRLSRRRGTDPARQRQRDASGIHGAR